MKNEQSTYIKNLINEEKLRILSEVKSSFSLGGGGQQTPIDTGEDEVSDEDYLLNNIFNMPASTDDQEVPSDETPNLKMNANAFQKASTSVHSDKGQISRQRSGQPFDKTEKDLDDLYVNGDVKNKYNKVPKDNKKPSIFGRIRVKFSRTATPKAYGQPIDLISLYNIDPIDVKELAKRFSNFGHTQRVNTAASRVNTGKKDAATFIVYDKVIDLWKKEDLPQIIDYLRNCVDENGTPKYGNDEQIKNLEETINNRIFTNSDVENYFAQAEQGTLDMYRKYFEAENDTEVNDIIELYQRGGVMDMVCKKLNLPTSFGHILSWKNAQAIISSARMTGRQATFVLPEEAWERVFGRVVKPNAQPYFVRIPNAHNKNGKWKNQGDIYFPYTDSDGKPQRQRLTCTEDILDVFYGGKPYNALSPQQKFFVNCLANINNVNSYFALREYDVSDTVWDPNLNPVDVWNDTIGLSNNLSGQLNQPAQQALADRQQALDSEEPEETDAVQDDAPENVDARVAEMMNRTKYAYDNVKTYADGKGIQYSDKKGDESSSLVSALYEIAKVEFPEHGITNPTLYEPLAKSSVYLICLVYKIALDTITGLRERQTLTDEELGHCVEVINDLANIVEGKLGGASMQDGQGKIALEESQTDGVLEPWSENPNKLAKIVRRFFTRLSSEAQTQQLHEMLDRMELSKKNLL